jgi:DNA topoisomerase-1
MKLTNITTENNITINGEVNHQPQRRKKMEVEEIQLTHKEFLTIDHNYEGAAAAVDLIYIKDNAEGITRVKRGNGFVYFLKNKKITDQQTLERIRKLAIPPAWKNVWICCSPNGHLQATGHDARNRKQYKYHPSWSSLRNLTKFHHLYEFGKALPALRQQIEQDISKKELSEEKVIATAIALMERTYIRIGNSGYEKMYGSYGLTTLKNKHVDISGPEIKISFKGKKGIYHKITLRNKKLAKIIKDCRDIPGSELFQYYDENGNPKSLDSGKVNQYIKAITKMDFTAKDFRLWAGSLNVLRAFKKLGEAMNVTACKQNVIAALEEVSKKLGNTRTICKKYYVHPGLIKLYEENKIQKYLSELDTIENSINTDLTSEEQVLMKILKTFNS